MICIACGHKKTSVTNSRYFASKHKTWRRRKCTQCEYIFTTYESLSLEQISVEGGRFEEIRLLLSIGRCLEHLTHDRIDATQGLTSTVIEKIISRKAQSDVTVLNRKDIAEITYHTLKHYDHLASVQYAARHSTILKRYLA